MYLKESVMDFSNLATQLDLDEEDYLELVEVFLEATISDLAKLESAISAGATEQVVEAAHSIKGAAGSLGFKDSHELAKSIEMNARKDILAGSLGDAGSIRRELTVIADSLREKQVG